MIIGYSYNSGCFCPRCADASFEHGELVRPASATTAPRYDEHRLPYDMQTVHGEKAVRMTRESHPDGSTCDDCGDSFPT